MEKPADDRAFIERAMYTGDASRRPVRRLLPRLIPSLVLLTGGIAYATGWVAWDGYDALAAEIPLPGGSWLLFEHHLFGLALCAGGLVFLRLAVRAFRTDHADARRASAR